MLWAPYGILVPLAVFPNSLLRRRLRKNIAKTIDSMVKFSHQSVGRGKCDIRLV